MKKTTIFLLALFMLNNINNVANAGEKINLKGVESITICNRKNDPDCMTDHDIKAALAEREALSFLDEEIHIEKKEEPNIFIKLLGDVFPFSLFF